MNSIVSKACSYATVFFLAAAASFAQEVRATLLGNVTDPTGLAVVGAHVTAVNTETTVEAATETNTGGYYVIPGLNPGTYRLRVTTTGFKTFERGPFPLRVNEQVRVDVPLELGAVTESVTVDALPTLLETQTAISGGVMEGSTIEDLPVAYEKTYQMMYYLPAFATVGYNSFSSLGLGDRQLSYTVDGVSAKEPVRGVVTDQSRAFQPSAISVAEIELVTTGMPAEFGHSASGMLTAVMKSGTNQLHGSAEDRFTFAQIIHRQYFDILPAAKPFYVHLVSASLGGPVYLPKIYNGKNKTFFFVGFQETLQRSTATGIADVPSADMYNGNFSFGGVGQPVYDPLTIRQNAAGTWISDPFPGNIIPKNRFDPVAVKYLGYSPWYAANATGYTDSLGVHQNLVRNTAAVVNRPYLDAKIDHQFSSANRLSARYSEDFIRGWNRGDTPVQWDLVSSSMAGQPVINLTNAVISDIHIINPSTVNSLRIGYNGRVSDLTPVDSSVGQGWAQKLGIPNVGPQSMPQFLTASGGSYYSAGMGEDFREVGEDFTVQESLTKVIGPHTFKAGYELLRSRFNSTEFDLPSGTYTMGGTGLPFTPNTGNDFAAFLLGSVTSATFTFPVATWLPRWWTHSLYFQDDYKVSKKLTLNLGLRWSYETPFATKYSQDAQFNPNVTDPLTGLQGAITHPKGPLASSNLNNFQPRIGLAWNFAKNFVFRGSFSVVTVDLLANNKDQNSEEYTATATVAQPTGNPSIAFLLSQGPPNIVFKKNADGTVPFVGTNYSTRTASLFDSHMRNPYVMNWSEGFQWQLASTWLIELNYQGSAGVKLLGTANVNTLPESIYTSTNTTLLNQVYQATQNYLPYPQFGAITYYSNLAHSTYHGATARVEKRYSSGITIQAAYTFSKAMSGGAGSGWEYYDWNLTKARCSCDLNDRVVATVVDQLPFGKGRRFMNQGGVKNVLLGGWNLTVVQMAQSGHPFSVTYGGSPYHYLPGPSLPFQILPNDQAEVQGWSIGPNRFPASAENPYLNINAFQYPAAFQHGTLGSNTFDGPILVWMQASVSKDFPIGERLKVRFRWDMNNPYKYNSFSTPNSTFNLASPASFGKISSVVDNFGSIGGRLHSFIVLRLEF